MIDPIGIFQPYAVTRNGSPVIGSPFMCREVTKVSSSSEKHENIPNVFKGWTPRFLIFQNTLAPVQVGDLITRLDGTYGKIVNLPRSYRYSLQVDMQIIPYLSGLLYEPKSAINNLDGNNKVQDVAYGSSTPILAYADPMDAMELGLPIGDFDARCSNLYTLQVLPLGSVVNLNSEWWRSTGHSKVWAVTNDYVTPMKYLISPPGGLY